MINRNNNSANTFVLDEDLDDDVDEFSSDEFDSLSDDTESTSLGTEQKSLISTDGNVYDIAEYVEGDATSQRQFNTNLPLDKSKATIIHTSSNIRPSHVTSLKSDNGTLNPTIAAADSTSKDNHEIFISSSSWINVQTEEEMKEPVKAPPRLKKLARIQQLQQRQWLQVREKQQQQYKLHDKHNLHRANSEGDMKKFNSVSFNPRGLNKLEISPPVLLATTFNPNDAENHKVLSNELLQAEDISKNNSTTIPSEKSSSFKDLKKLSSLFPSFSSLNNSLGKEFASIASRSSFYVAEAVYEEAANRKDSPPLLTDHIYEEIPERINNNSEAPSSLVRPLPPIPEQQEVLNNQRRSGSIFEGASKYEILHYLRDAKDRIGYSDIEIEIDDEGFDNSFIGKRNHTHRVSAISHSSDSSTSSVESNSSSAVSSGDGSVLFRGSAEKMAIRNGVDIERADSGVGSENSFKFKMDHFRSAANDGSDTGVRCLDCNIWMDKSALER